LAAELNLEVMTPSVERTVNVLQGQCKIDSKLVQVQIQPLDSNETFQITAFTVKDFLSKTHIPNWAEHLPKYDHLKQLKIPSFTKEDQKIDILLGTDYFKLLLAHGLPLVGGDNEPAAEKTSLGWMIGGPIENYDYSKLQDTHLMSSMWITHLAQEETNLHDLVSRTWELDDLGLAEQSPGLSSRHEAKRPWTKSEIESDAKMECIYLEKEKLYQLSFPWKKKPPNLSLT
jgi:hypothetical protein